MELKKIGDKIITIRGVKVITDFDLAALYGIETKQLKRQVKRNIDRFPQDFMFQLTKEEFENLRCQFGSSSFHGGRRYMPFVFTEQGVAMISSVIKNEMAIKVNIYIMRTFVSIRKFALSNDTLRDDLKRIEKDMNLNLKQLYRAIDYLMKRDEINLNKANRSKIGFKKMDKF